MTYFNQAVKLAIENGWNAKPNSVVVMSGAFVLEPDFWEALGEGLGWSNYAVCRQHGIIQDNCKYGYPSEWRYQARQYFDLIMNKQSTEPFFKELLEGRDSLTKGSDQR